MVLDRLSNFSANTDLIFRYLQIFRNISTLQESTFCFAASSEFLLLVDLSKPFTLCHKKQMRTHSNHLSDSSVNMLHVCSTNVQMCTQSLLSCKEGWHRAAVISVQAAVFCASTFRSNTVYLGTWHSDTAPVSSQFTSIFTRKYLVPSIMTSSMRNW